jgi:NADH oxidase (H2O2-forming)
VVAGLVTEMSIVNPDQKLIGQGINVVLGKATGVDIRQKLIHISNGSSINYDKVILATGAKPFIPPIEGSDLEGVFTLRGLEDAETIKRFLKDKEPKRLIFMGAGFISMEVASMLASLTPGKYDISVIEMLDRPLPLMLDTDLGNTITRYFEEKGITMLMGRKVNKILGQDGHVSGVELDAGESIAGDMIFVNVGVRPNVELAKDIGLDMSPFGIKVNKYQETSHPDIFACGDCVEKQNFITKKATGGQLRGPAVMQGRVAAMRLAGYDVEFPGVINSGGCYIFEKTVAATGFTEDQAHKENYKTVSATVDSRSQHGMIPGYKPWTLKLVFDRDTQKLIGGQIISDAKAPAKEINAVGALILGGKTIADVATFMIAANPDIASEPSMEPIAIAAAQALQKLQDG